MTHHQPRTAMRRVAARIGAAFAALVFFAASAMPAAAANVSWPEDANLQVGSITLVVLTGSSADSLVVNPNSFRVVVAAAETFHLRYPGLNAGTLAFAVNSGTPPASSCNIVGINNDVDVVGPADITFTPNQTICPGAAQSGGVAQASQPPSVTLSTPNGGEVLTAGAAYGVFWGSGGSGVQGVRLSLSTDGGTAYATVADNLPNSSMYTWTVPSSPTAAARMKVSLLGSGGSVLVSDESNANFTIQSASAASGGGTATTTDTTTPPPATGRVTVRYPNGGETFKVAGAASALWLIDVPSGSGADPVYAQLSYSSDGGATYLALTGKVLSSGGAAFTVPAPATAKAKAKVTAFFSDGTSVSDESDAAFTVVADEAALDSLKPFVDSTSVTPTGGTFAPTGYTDVEKAAPSVDPNATGGYVAGSAEAATPTIDVDKKILPPPPDKTLPCVGGELMKIPTNAAVYYCGKNGRRYVFPNMRIYMTWFTDFSKVRVMSVAEIAKIPIAGNVTYRPGIRMVKIQSDPKVYAIARDGLLRWVKTEAAAQRLYGAKWNQMIDDVPDSFFFNYTIGDPIE